MASKKPNLFTFIRSGLRRMSRTHAPIYEALAASKIKYIGDNPRQKYSYICALCGGAFAGKEVAVDHRVDCGKLAGWEDVSEFMQRLFCDASGLDVLCHTCHDAKTYATKHDVTMEEAKLQKNVIAFIKDKTAKQLLAYLKLRGYDGASVSNADKRRKLVETILRREDE